MQAANCYYNFSCVQHGSLLIEFLIFSQIGKQFSAIQEIYYKVQFSLSLESKMKLNNISYLILSKRHVLSLLLIYAKTILSKINLKKAG